jgi:hypothetical protein
MVDEECSTIQEDNAFNFYLQTVNKSLAVLEAYVRCSVRCTMADDAFDTLQGALTTELRKPFIDGIYEVKETNNKKGPKFMELSLKRGALSDGIVEQHVPSLKELAEGCVFFPVSYPPQSFFVRFDRMKRLKTVKGKLIDLYDILRLFSDLVQFFEDTKVRDVHWFLTVATVAQLWPYVRTTERLERWPSFLRNGSQHAQVQTLANHTSLYNLTNDGKLTFQLIVNTCFLVNVLTRFFEALKKSKKSRRCTPMKDGVYTSNHDSDCPVQLIPQRQEGSPGT